MKTPRWHSHEQGRVARPMRGQDQIGLMRWLPGLYALRHYELSWLPRDILAGLVLSVLLVPVGVAYAVAAGLPGITGLYATIAGLLAYAVFGPSRILVLGPDSSLSALILAVVIPLSLGDPDRAISLAGMMAMVSGLLCVFAGLARLGFVTELLSKPIRYGYMNGIALTVITSQLPALFGFDLNADGLLNDSRQFALLVATWTNFTVLAIGVGTLVTILLLKRYPSLPGVMIAVTGATLVAGSNGLIDRAGIPVLGPLAQGLPDFVWPTLRSNDLGSLLGGGLAVALVSSADSPA